MPTTREVVPNSALGGHELKSLLLADFARLLENFGILSPHIAFGRCAYTLSVSIQTDKHLRPHEISTTSRPLAQNLVAADASLGAVESSPLLAPSPDADTAARERTRTITSGNAERLREGMPVPVIRAQKDGSKITERISYGSQPELGAGDVRERDISPAALAAEAAEAERAARAEREARRTTGLRGPDPRIDRQMEAPEDAVK